MHNQSQDKALLVAILEAAVDAIIVSDEVGCMLQANGAACSLFGYAADEMIGQNVKILMPGSLAAHHDRYMADHIKTGENRIIGIGREVEGLRKDKTIFPLHLSVGETQVGDQRMYIGILHNLTFRKATQDALARSQRMDAVGQMTGGIAHDFNNLLTVIVGNLELLEMRGAAENQLPLIKDALDAAELGVDLTSRLLIFARQSNLRPIQTDLRDLCEDALALLRRTMGASFRIKTDFAPDVKQVMIDPIQLQSALMNLAFNARDAMGASGELLVSVSNVTIDDNYMAQETDIEPGDYVRLSVSDDGAGMSMDVQKRALEPFFTTKSDSGGTGLGLAMVYGFVRQSGGHVTLYSELGHGTSFGLYFPAVPDEAKDKTERAHRKGKPDTLSPPGRGETVLVVEDNPKVRKLSVARIRDLGFKVIEAASGDDAYRMLETGTHADIVFSDLVMPGALSGYDLAARVAAEFPHLKVLLTSGYASDAVTDTMAHDRIYDILHKPYRQADLARRLKALLPEAPGA